MKPWSLQQQFFPTIDSTNLWSKQFAYPKDLNTMIIVRAGEQTEGRGQHGRRWTSPPDCNLYQSYTFLLPNLEHVIHIAQVLCLSTLHVLQGYTLSGHVKWPNDVYVEGKKIAGVLCEIFDHRCTVGIGINLNMSEKELENIPQAATSAKVLLGQEIAIDPFAESLNQRFLEDLSVLLEKGFSPFYADYLNYLLYLDQMVSWTFGDEVHIGRFKGIDAKGRALLFLKDQQTEIVVHSGQIRPYESDNF